MKTEMNQKKRKMIKLAGCYLGLVVLVALFVTPFYWLLVSAFKNPGDMFSSPPVFFPSDWTLDNFVDTFRDTSIVTAFFNSVIIAGGHCILSVFLCALCGYAFAKFPNAPGRNALFAFLLGTMIIPDSVNLIPSFLVMVKFDLVNSFWSLILPGAANAFGIFWMRQYFSSNLPDSLIESARIDGCSELKIFLRIALPIVKPALAALFVLRLMGSWNNLMWAFVMLRTEDKQTMPVLVYLLQSDKLVPYGLIMAASLLITLPLVLAFLFMQRFFIAGITQGAVKG